MVINDQHPNRHENIIPPSTSGTSLNFTASQGLPSRRFNDRTVVSPHSVVPSHWYEVLDASPPFILILTSALAALSCVGASSATAPPSHPQTLLFDAVALYERTAGPVPNQIGHEQIASGVLRNSRGHTIGRLAFTCTWIQNPRRRRRARALHRIRSHPRRNCLMSRVRRRRARSPTGGRSRPHATHITAPTARSSYVTSGTTKR